MTAMANRGETPPRDRVAVPEFKGPGYAIALHGDMVVHRAAALAEPAERISMVNAYVATDTSKDDQHRHKDLTLVDNPDVIYTEWARHAAWRARDRLDNVIAQLPFSSDRQHVASTLEAAVRDVNDAVNEMRDESEHSLHHYEKKLDH